MMYKTIKYEKKDKVALITLNRPERLNAWTPLMSSEQVSAITHANEDSNIGSIVMTGSGKGFCAGADMEEALSINYDDARIPDETDWVDLIRSSKPIIAAVNGSAIGVGITMVLPFDTIIASEKSKFGMFFIKIGLVPELGSSHYLVQRMGFGKASEFCLSGRLIDAKEAFKIGLIDFLYSEEDMLEEAIKKAKLIAENPGPQLRMVKELLTKNGSETDLTKAQERESALLRECWKTPEHKEAVKNFLKGKG